MANPGRRQSLARFFGLRQETRAGRYLQCQGLQPVCRNYLCKQGEIDLVMIESGQFLVFVEVRFRGSTAFGDAIASVSRHKQRRCRLAASHFLRANPGLNHLACRFDVVGVTRGNRPGQMQFEWIRDAFR